MDEGQERRDREGTPGERGRGRAALVLALTAAAVAVEVLVIYYGIFFSCPVHNSAPTLDTRWTDGSMVVTRVVDPSVAGGFRKGDRLLSVITDQGREIPIRGAWDEATLARTIHYGESFTVQVARRGPGGAEHTLTIGYRAVPETARTSFLPRLAGSLPSIVIFLACVAAALLIGLSRPQDEGAFVASLMFLSFGALTWHGDVLLFAPLIAWSSYLLWVLLYALVTPTLFWFCLRFPSPSPIDRRLPWLKRMGVAFGFVFAAWNGVLGVTQQLNQEVYDRYLESVRYFDWVLDVIFCLLALAGIAALLQNLRRAASPDERRRLTILLCGILGLTPWLLNYILAVTIAPRVPLAFQIFVLAAMLLFPLSFIYAVLRHRVFGIRVILRRGLRFALLSRGFLFVEGALIFALLYFAAGPSVAKAAGGAHGGTLTVAIAAATAAIVAVIRKANTRVMAPMERRFFREAYDARSVLTSLTLNVRRLVGDPDALAGASVRTVADALHPRSTALFLRAGVLATLPSEGDRARLIRHNSLREAPSTFLCFWRSRGDANAEEPENAPVGPAVRINGDSILATLMSRPGGPPPILSLDPLDPRSDAGRLVESATDEEIAVVEKALGTRLAVPLSVGDDLLGFLCLGEKLSEEPYSREDCDLLSALAQQMADTLDHARLLHQSEEQAQIRREVEIAQQVQRNLLPAAPPEIPGLDLAGACRPARYVGGDYYDFIRSGEKGVAMALGDISGKGISAALLMAALQATLREKADAVGRRPADVISGVNLRLCASAGEGRFSTLFYGLLDAGTLSLEYASAGHNAPILYRPQSGEVVRLAPTGTVVGIFTDAAYGQRTVRLRQGDLLIVFSDGITEAMNEAQEFFEEERLLALLPSLTGLTAAQARDLILGAVEAFVGPAPQADDITLVVARVL